MYSQLTGLTSFKMLSIHNQNSENGIIACSDQFRICRIFFHKVNCNATLDLHKLVTSDMFKSNQKVELSNQAWANNSNCEANHSNRISANSMRMPIAFSLGFSL